MPSVKLGGKMGGPFLTRQLWLTHPPALFFHFPFSISIAHFLFSFLFSGARLPGQMFCGSAIHKNEWSCGPFH